MARGNAGGPAPGGEDVPALRPNGTRVATALASLACLALLAAVPVTRSSGAVHATTVRLGSVAVIVLVLGLVLGWSPLLPLGISLAGASYATQLALDDEPLDQLAPVLAVAVVLSAELAYWSLEEREDVADVDGRRARHVAVVAALALGALTVGSALLALVDVVHARSLAVDVLGAAAAAVALLAVVALGRRRS